jgi:hypothetical protein
MKFIRFTSYVCVVLCTCEGSDIGCEQGTNHCVVYYCITFHYHHDDEAVIMHVMVLIMFIWCDATVYCTALCAFTVRVIVLVLESTCSSS